ncbi:MAG: SRPBCC family protein [Bdellovibrionales bacterium]|nr:SRPBCC family protein [Bdellovibrionales bacterium]
MSRHKLESEFWVPVALDKVWATLSDPKNLAQLTPATYGARVSANGTCRDGLEVTIELAPLGLEIPMNWVSVLSGVRSEGPSREFTDHQRSGPFAYWQHRHLFEAGSESIPSSQGQVAIKMKEPGTWIRDFVEYENPLSMLGEVAHQLFGRRSLEKLFAYRREQTLKMLGVSL